MFTQFVNLINYLESVRVGYVRAIEFRHLSQLFECLELIILT